MSHFGHQNETEILQSKENRNFKVYDKRTVGKVSLVVGARADALVTLYANDHRPQASSSDTPPSIKRELPQTLGDVCHACKKRVFVVERLSAEGFHFHRECFRCETCRAPLRQGGHCFHSEEGKLYCELHFSQRKSLVKNGRTETLHTACDDSSPRSSSWSPESREDHLQAESAEMACISEKPSRRRSCASMKAGH